MAELGKYQGHRFSTQQVLQLYDAGERDFQGAILCGCNFQDTVLSDANFSFSDIRSSNFSRAILVNTQFVKAKVGVLNRYLLCQFLFGIIVFVAVGLLGRATTGTTLGLIFHPETRLDGISNVTHIAFVALLLCTYLGFTIAIYLGGFLFSVSLALTAIALSLLGAIFVALLGHLEAAQIISFYVSIPVVVSITNAFAVATAMSIAFVIVGKYALYVLLSEMVVGFVAVHLSEVETNVLVSFIGAVLIVPNIFIGYLIAQQAYTGNAKHNLFKNIANWLGCLWSTKFIEADLTNANFAETNLSKTRWYAANLTGTCFHLAQNLHFARLGNTILSNPKVLNLVVTLRGKNQPFMGLNLKGAYLAGADLTNADFTEADLNQARVENALMTGANLTRAQVLGTNFYRTELTGATLEAWNIDSTTQLEGAICDYVYLLNSQQERRPNSGVFKAGEFTQLFQEVLDTIDLIFQNGIDWKAFARTFAQVQVQYEDTELSVQSIENKGEGTVVVKLNAPPGADKAAIHQSFSACYQTSLKETEARYKAQLEAKDEQIVTYRQQNANMQEIVKMLANRPVTVDVKAIAESKSMQGNDYSRNISIGGDFSPSGSNVNITLGDISGQVSNEISQLPDTASNPGQPSLKELLTQLKEAIETDTELSNDEKAEALGEVAKLAKAGSNPKEGAMQRIASRANSTLKAIAESLTDASTLATACKSLLPMIAMLF